MQPESNVRLDGGQVSDEMSGAGLHQPLPEDMPCFPVREVVLTGSHSSQFQFALEHALRKSGFYAGKCLNAAGINEIMTLAQNHLIDRGYTTTRILAAPQDLNSGKLELTVLAGKIRAIQINQGNGQQTHAERIAAFQNEFPIRSDGILNLRDLEQGLENLKRVPTAEADIQIVPVEGAPDESDVLVHWRQRLLPYRLVLGADNSGSAATGKYQANMTFSADNPLGLSDLFYVSYGRAIGNVPDEAGSTGSLKKGGTRNYALHYSAPFGKWLWSFNHNGYRYHQAVAGLHEAYDYNGRSINTDFGFNRLVYRDARRKTHFGAKLWSRQTQTYIDDAEITVQRRKTAGWTAELSHKEYFHFGTADFKIAYKRGTGMKNALDAPEQAFGEGTARMKIWTAAADINIPFRIGRQHFAYDSSLHGQWNKTALTPQDKIAIGSRYTVRGFDGEMSLAGERGWYWRNDLSWQFKPGLRLYLGADMGHVSGPSAQRLAGQNLAGVAVGLRGQFKAGGNLYYDFFTGRALKKPANFNTKKWTGGFQLGYSF